MRRSAQHRSEVDPVSTNGAVAHLAENLVVADELRDGRIVERIARVLAVVPTLGPVSRAWRRLGFEIAASRFAHSRVLSSIDADTTPGPGWLDDALQLVACGAASVSIVVPGPKLSAESATT